MKRKKLISEERPVEGYIKGWSRNAQPIIVENPAMEPRKLQAYNIFRATRELYHFSRKFSLFAQLKP